MAFTDTEKINYKKLIIAGIITIIVSVISSLLVAYFKQDNEKQKLPKADLIYYQFSERLFSLEYPSFLVGTEEMINPGAFSLALGRIARFMLNEKKNKKTKEYNFELAQELFWKKMLGKEDPNFMLIIVNYSGKYTQQVLDKALQFQQGIFDPSKSEWVKDRYTESKKETRKDKFIIDKLKTNEGIFYNINRFFTINDSFFVTMLGFFGEKYLENYRKEIETSYYSIHLDPTRAMNFVQEQYKKQQAK